MRSRSLLILVLLVGALGAFIWFFERDLPSADERRERAAKVIPVDVDDVEAISIETQGARIRLERSAQETTGAFVSEWHLVDPVQVAADANAVTELLEMITSLEKERTLDEVADAEVGLEPPRLTITLEAQTRSWELAVGADLPATEHAVLRVRDEGLFVASRKFVESLHEGAQDWRSRDALSFEEPEIEGVVVTSGGGDLVFSRTDEGFVLESPVSDAADGEKVAALLRELDDLSASEFVEDSTTENESALFEPAHRIALNRADRDAIVLEIGGLIEESSSRWLMRLEGTVFVAESEIPALLDRPVEDWQTRRWTGMRTFEIESAQIAVGDQAVHLVRRQGSWFAGDSESTYTLVADLLDLATTLEAEALLPGEARSGSDVVVMEVDLSAGQRTDSLRLEPLADGGYRAAVAGRDFALIMGDEAVADLIAAFEAIAREAAVSEVADGADESEGK